MFYGKGAGKEATASAVVADIMDCAKHLKARKYLFWEEAEENYVDSSDNEFGKFYVSLKSNDYGKMKNSFSEILMDNEMSFVENKYQNTISLITQPISKKDLLNKLENFEDCEIKVLHTMC